MKVSPKTRGVYSTLWDGLDQASIDYKPYSCDPVARVVEFPKVWREGGKQYEVVTCTYTHNGDGDDRVKIKAPSRANAFAFGCEDTIEYY